MSIPFAFIVTIFLLFPAVRDFALTFTDFDPLRPHALRWVGFEQYGRAVSSSDFWVAWRNLAVFVACSVTLELLFGGLIALALREPFRGRSLVRALLLAPWLVNPVAAGVMARFLSGNDGPVARLVHLSFPSFGASSDLRALGLALPALIALEVWRVVPLVTLLVLPGITAIPAARWDQARLEGFSLSQVGRHVIWPALRPLLLAVTLLLLANALSSFEGVLMFTGGGPGAQTVLPGLLAYLAGYKTYDWALGSSLSWLVVAAVVLVGLCYLGLCYLGLCYLWSPRRGGDD